MNLKKYKVTYTTTGADYNIRFVKASDICTALRDFVHIFPEVEVTELIEV